MLETIGILFMLVMGVMMFLFWEDIKKFSTHRHKYKCGLICLIYTALCSFTVGFLSFFSLLQEAI